MGAGGLYSVVALRPVLAKNKIGGKKESLNCGLCQNVIIATKLRIIDFSRSILS